MSSRLFRDVHHPRHWTAAAHGCLKPAPASRLRRVLLHLWYSIALHERVLDTTSRKSSIFLRRIVGVVFMRVNAKCAHQVRLPPGVPSAPAARILPHMTEGLTHQLAAECQPRQLFR